MKICVPLSVVLLLCLSCKDHKRQFKSLHSAVTGIEFNNEILDSDSFNILTYEYIYNGGGVAIADFNNDGLQDIYFTGNLVSNELYLNQGAFKFKKVTKESRTGGENKWSGGVVVADVNADGWQDIYICATAYPDPEQRRNILYINEGVNADGVPVFADQAETYNLNDTSHSTHAAFIDYDNDNDLDLFLMLNKMSDGRTPNIYHSKGQYSERVDKLFRNDWSDEKGHPVFTDVSEESGIIHPGFSLGVNITDINQDGWSDIYVTNDYLSNDLIYINKGNGTFEDRAAKYFKHTSHSAMGNDVIDINNDGLPDVIVVDMLPEDNFRKKTMLPPNNYTFYINNEKYGYQYQYTRNTLQLNRGIDPGTGDLVFSDVSFMSGISSTDWSWAPLVADFDNDGFRDVIITNGFPKDVTDRDFIEYHNQTSDYATKGFLMNFMPSVKIKNYAYRNRGGYTFEDVTEAWGIRATSFSNGAAYGDLDNDGDLDYVVNNINAQAFVYQNMTNDHEGDNHHWLRVKLKGRKNNPSGFGAKVRVYYGNGRLLYADHNTSRGFLSTVEEYLHFGLGEAKAVDSIVVEWPDGYFQKVENQPADQLVTLDIQQAQRREGKPFVKKQALLLSDTSSLFGDYKHEEKDFIDFNLQPLLFHKLSQYGPGIAVGDVNKDGLDDLYIGGSHNVKGTFFIQTSAGSFQRKDLIPSISAKDKREEELGILFFDADGDGDQDLYSVSGGYEYSVIDSCYKHVLYENSGGIFKKTPAALPNFLLSGSCVRAADYDRDGDLDLFVGGRVLPHQYPSPVNSFLLRNDSKTGSIRFTVANDQHAPGLSNLGMVCDALWSDFDNDGWTDLILAGEWMPLRFFKNHAGVLRDSSAHTGIFEKVGWWNSLTGADFDNDGDVDYVAGNLGLNTLVQASDEEPVSIYAADFDKNERFDIMPTVYFKNKSGKKEEFPFFGRLDVQKELIKTKAKFLKHADFADATVGKVLSEEQLKGALVYRANYFSSSYIENEGKGKFTIRPLPLDAQIAPLYGMVAEDVNGDGNTDLVAVGNDFGTEVSMGRFDALNGLVMLGNGKGDFAPTTMQQSGICVSGDAKAFASLFNPSGDLLMVSTQNRGPLKAYQRDLGCKSVITPEPDVQRVQIKLRNGSTIVREIYYGSGFLSQSSRRVCIPSDAVGVVLISFTGEQYSLTDF